MSRTLSRGRKRPGPIFGWTRSLFYMVNPRASPPSRVSVRRPSCSLISARGARALGIPLLRLGPSSSSESVVVLAGPAPARRKKSGNGPQRPQTRRPGGMTSSGWRGRALGGLHHAAERPAPARELPGDRAVGHRRWQVPVRPVRPGNRHRVGHLRFPGGSDRHQPHPVRHVARRHDAQGSCQGPSHLQDPPTWRLCSWASSPSSL